MAVTDYSHFAKICCYAAKLGGQILLQKRDEFSIREKAPNDLVTDADIASQKAIEEIIKNEFADHAFLGEESVDSSSEKTALPNQNDAKSSDSELEFRWIVDPLDGTINYIHGLQSYSVSIALQHNGKLIVGAVYDPVLDELFFSASEQVATLNDRPIQSSNCTELKKSLIAVSLPSSARSGDLEIRRMLRLIEGTRSIRRLGSAALNLCYVAAGRLDGYLATSVNIWDIAAGALIVQQAGGTLRHVDDRELDLEDPQMIAASTNKLWRQIHLQIQD